MQGSLAFSAALLPLAMLAGTVAQTARLAARWRVGRPSPVALLPGLLAMPKRYLVDVHHVVARDPYAARMHMLAAGGLVAGTALMLGGLVPALGSSSFYWLVPIAAFLTALAGILMVGYRRRATPQRLSRGRFQTLPLWLALYAIGALAASVAVWGDASVTAVMALLLALAGGLGLVGQIPTGPMRHAIAGAIHLAAHPRPQRFTSRDTALKPIDLTADRLGLDAPADFNWPSLAGLDACVQCGRCEESCPAFAAGLPLNPKKLIQDIAACLTPGGTDLGYAGSPHPGVALGGVGSPTGPVIGAMIRPETLWSCTTCRACVEACPMMIEHVDAIVGLRRHQVLALGEVPGKAAAALDELRYADNPSGRAPGERLDFAGGLDLPIACEGSPIDALLWLGDGAYDLRYGRTLRALVELMHRAGIAFAVLGAAERDCGDLARRLGDEATFARLARDNIATLARYRFDRIVTADPHAYHVLKHEYPAFGGEYRVVHHTTLLADLVEAGRLAPRRQLEGRITYHDPCYLSRYDGAIERPRAVLRHIGVELLEMERSGTRSMCCGAGGGSALTDVPSPRRIPDLRMDQAKATGATMVAVACPNCTAMLEGVTGARPEVRDVAELLLAAMAPA